MAGKEIREDGVTDFLCGLSSLGSAKNLREHGMTMIESCENILCLGRGKVHRLLGIVLIAGSLVTPTPAYALDGTDANMKEVIENVEKQTTKNGPRLVVGLGILVSAATSIFSQNVKPLAYGTLISLGSGGAFKWVDKTFAATLDDIEAAPFLKSEEELRQDQLRQALKEATVSSPAFHEDPSL